MKTIEEVIDEIRSRVEMIQNTSNWELDSIARYEVHFLCNLLDWIKEPPKTQEKG